MILKHLRPLPLILGLASFASSTIALQAQAVGAATSSASFPDAPGVSLALRPSRQETVPAAWSSSNLGFLPETQNQQATQDQQNPDKKTTDSQKPIDTLEKPIHQNPIPTRDPQTKRIAGIIPNFRSVSTDEKLPPMSVKEKFLTATDDSFDYSSIFIPAALAGFSMARRATPEFGQGAVGYGRYLWHSAVDQTSENYMVEFILPSLTHEDNRYYTLGRGGFFKRTGYAVSRAVITRSDSGHDTFNISEVVGAGASSGLSSLYYPSRERTFGNTASEWGLDIGIDGASFVVKEFWPDINRKLFHQSDPDGGARH
jgi:hypothetical protein